MKHCVLYISKSGHKGIMASRMYYLLMAPPYTLVTNIKPGDTSISKYYCQNKLIFVKCYQSSQSYSLDNLLLAGGHEAGPPGKRRTYAAHFAHHDGSRQPQGEDPLPPRRSRLEHKYSAALVTTLCKTTFVNKFILSTTKPAF